MKVALVLCFLLIQLFPGPARSAGKGNDSKNLDRVKSEQELNEISLALRKAILAKDLKAVLDLAKHGGTCVDAEVTYKEFKKEIGNKKGYPYRFLFDPRGYKGMANDQRPVSAIEFLQAAKDLSVSIEFRGKEFEWALIRFSSKKFDKPLEFDFLKRGSEWGFGDLDWFCNSN